MVGLFQAKRKSPYLRGKRFEQFGVLNLQSKSYDVHVFTQICMLKS